MLLSALANPDAIRYLVPAALFAGRLATWNHYRSETCRLRDLEGILLHQFHRRTGVVHAGLHAFGTLAALAEGAGAPEDPLSRGMVSYNAAAAGFTLLNNVHRAVLSEDPEEIRSWALRLAENARASFEADGRLPRSRGPIRRVRTHQLPAGRHHPQPDRRA
ncbi:hypothetical protein ACFCX7_26970 [Streptomyces microflavus]|uniref:hypothetical protein n=1 Tax=Streptomyces microflavus TaxID=1919 RepID=UPI0035DC9B90